MKLISRIVRVILGWLQIGTSKFENANIDAIIANLESEKDKAKSTIFNKMVTIKTSINSMEKEARSFKESMNQFDMRARKALENGKNDLAAEFSVKYENVNKQYNLIKTTLDNALETYKELIKTQSTIIETYDNKIQQIKIKATSVTMNEELANIKDIANLSGDNNMMGLINDVDKILDKKDSKASASIEVSDTLNQNDLEAQEFEENIGRNEALERLKARMFNE